LAKEMASPDVKHNVGSLDRLARVVVGLALIAVSLFWPGPPLVRFALLDGTGAYLLLTSLLGSCLGYRLMGRSTCPRQP
jgi:Protein of unknown function (DUF2892)